MKKWMLITLIVILALVFAGSLAYLLIYFHASNENTTLYNDLSQIVEEVRQDPTLEPDATVLITQPDSEEEVGILSEYAPIYEKNPDLVGWIEIDGTAIDYPVLQRKSEPNYYLKRNFEGASSDHGAIYVSESCDVSAPSDNIVIYGHNMKDGSMFAGLHSYKDKTFYESHPFVQFDTLNKRQTYQIVSVFLISSTQDNPFKYHLFVDAADEQAFQDFIAGCRKNQLYSTGVEAQYGDKLITLSTCEYSNLNGRLVVVAKLVE